jgi:ribonuclease HI
MKYYAVKVGRKIGIYYSWADCKEQTDKYPKAVFKSFTDINEANSFINGIEIKTDVKVKNDNYIKNSINCDGAYSSSTGIMEFNIKDTETGLTLLSKNYDGGTNNIAEFLGLVNAMAFLHEKGQRRDKVIYTDSITAISWVKNCKVNSSYDLSTNYILQQEIEEALFFLSLHPSNKFLIEKWDTVSWGEIPSDFGRK